MMPIASSWSDAVFLVAFAAIVTVVTALAVRLFGNRLKARNRALAVVVCSSIVPVLIVGLAFLQVATAPRMPPPNDAPAMAFIAILSLAALSIPVSFATSAVLILRSR